MAAARVSSRQIFPRLNHFINCTRRAVTFRQCSSTTEEAKTVENFDEMFRNSQFVKLGRPKGKKVLGRVTHVVTREKDKDVYVDFGWKFHAVDTLPLKREIEVGDKVEVTIKSLESTGHFLGQSKRITLNEAEAKFVKIKNISNT